MSDWKSGENDAWPAENPAWSNNNAAWKDNNSGGDDKNGDMNNITNGVASTGFGDDENTAGSGDNLCRNCNQSGHFAKECPEPRKQGACFNCGEEGHSKADCPNPRKENRECRLCNEQGHLASDCPTRKCRQCLEVGHDAIECKNAKVIDKSHIVDKTEAEAWNMLKVASDDRDLDDFREAFQVLCKAVPEYTYSELEKHFRKREFSVYLIAMEKEIGATYTNVNLQGEVGKKFVVGFYLSDKPQRPNMVAKWPPSPEENLKRLDDAGVPVDRGVEKCLNCKEIGHNSRRCPQEKQEHDRVKVMCALCGEEGHRVRDCLQERKPAGGGRACRVCESTDHMAKDCPNKEKRACRNCGEEDHMAKDCPTREKRTCRNCGSEDHMARECDQPRNPATMTCRNCDEQGHMSKECPKPTDWSRVTCRNCGEKGHGPRRCPQPPKVEEETNGGFDSGFGDSSGFENSNVDTKVSSAQQGWEKEDTSTPAAASADAW